MIFAGFAFPFAWRQWCRTFPQVSFQTILSGVKQTSHKTLQNKYKRYCKNNLHSFIHLKIFLMTHLKIYMKNIFVWSVILRLTAWSSLTGMKKIHHYFCATFLQQEQVFASPEFKDEILFLLALSCCNGLTAV